MDRRRLLLRGRTRNECIFANEHYNGAGRGIKPKVKAFNFDETTEVYGRASGEARVFIGSPDSVFDLVDNRNVMAIGQWSFSGVNHYCFRGVWASRKTFPYNPNVVFDFTLSVRNGYHVWSEDGTIDHTINDKATMDMIRGFIGNSVVALRGKGLVNYIKTRKIK